MSPFAQTVESLKPWVHGFWHEGHLWGGGEAPAPEDLKPVEGTKAHDFLTSFPGCTRFLELGALEGVDTVQLASISNSNVVAIEGRESNFRKLEFISALRGLSNARLILDDIEEIDFSSLGDFDACMCSGVLYHVWRPWALLRKIRMVAPRVYLWTHYWGSNRDTELVDCYSCKVVEEAHPVEALRGIRPHVRWLTFESLVRAINDAGFPEVRIIRKSSNGPIGTVALTALD